MLHDLTDSMTLIDGVEILENEALLGGGIFVSGDGSRLHIQNTSLCDNQPENIHSDDWIDDGGNSDCSCPGDYNQDGVVNGSDLARLLSKWGQEDPLLDLNGDLMIGGPDLTVLLGGWGLCN